MAAAGWAGRSRYLLPIMFSSSSQGIQVAPRLDKIYNLSWIEGQSQLFTPSWGCLENLRLSSVWLFLSTTAHEHSWRPEQRSTDSTFSSPQQSGTMPHATSTYPCHAPPSLEISALPWLVQQRSSIPRRSNPPFSKREMWPLTERCWLL